MTEDLNQNSLHTIQQAIRTIPNFPQPGIQFKDITPLLKDGETFSKCITLMSERVKELGAETIVGLDARGFIFGAAIADRLSLGFVPIRKPGKLPHDTISVDYSLEYNTNTLELHTDALRPNEKVVVVDDVLATGGTAHAAQQLVTQQGAYIVGFLFLMELTFLNGRDILPDKLTHSLIKY